MEPIKIKQNCLVCGKSALWHEQNNKVCVLPTSIRPESLPEVVDDEVWYQRDHLGRVVKYYKSNNGRVINTVTNLKEIPNAGFKLG